MTGELVESIGNTQDIDLMGTGFTYKTLQAISNTEFVPRGLRGNVPAILACVMAGKELGLDPMESLNKIDVIDGRPSPSGELMVAMVMRRGHEIYPSPNNSDTAATAIGVRTLPNGDTREVQFTFTWQDAERAKLTGKDNWKKYPGPMLYWRAVTQLVRIYFPDCLTSFKAYTPDELGSADWIPEDPDTPFPSYTETGEPTGPITGSPQEIGTPDEHDETNWNELLHAVSNNGWLTGTNPVIETNSRRICELMQAEGMWNFNSDVYGDVFHHRLDMWGHVDQAYMADEKTVLNPEHWGDLRRKEHYQRFAHWIVEQAQERISQTMRERDNDHPVT